ncbi:enolase C-terminal domain-like protein [Clostridium sp. MCC328]|uniref:enolase C-terminal domain-like protein n=1 Tax=Clostridium sp. MCC328 TaxID=2592642 RepID=UPI001C01AE15|nr:enolase C-terminal domain-like protein [Clostridium sp. MCC328]MBT9819762.1 mandelate racemase [Clostridium sp. MCC328]
MIITKFETWWVTRDKCLFDEKRQGGAKMGWDVFAIKLTADDGTEGIATCMAARSGGVTESYLHDSIAPILLGRDPHDREALFYELWNVDRHEAFFPVFLPGPVDVALWDMCAKATGLPLYKYIGAYRTKLPVYASGNFHAIVQEYVDEALYYKNKGILGYKAHPGGPVEFDMKVHEAVREAVGPGYTLMSDPVGEYTLDDAVRVARQLERLGYEWFEEPFRDFELYKYTELCKTVDIPIAATETTRGCHWGVAQSVAQHAADIVRADVSWKDGVTGTLKIAHMADSFGLNCEIHTTTMNYMDLANVHVSCSIRNCKYFEYFVPEDNYRLPMKGDLPIRDGYIYVPDKPGVGAELDWDLINANCHSYRCQSL